MMSWHRWYVLLARYVVSEMMMNHPADSFALPEEENDGNFPKSRHSWAHVSETEGTDASNKICNPRRAPLSAQRAVAPPAVGVCHLVLR